MLLIGEDKSSLQVMDTVTLPKLFAYSKPPITYGVRPLAAIPTKTSFSLKLMS